MVRKWAVRPDPETGIANRQEIVEALMDGEAMLHRAGGVLEVVVSRIPTDLPGEMVTYAVVFAWKDRTDAKPQPEQASPTAVDVVDPTPEEHEAMLEAEDAADDAEARFLAEAEQGEDESAMEAAAR